MSVFTAAQAMDELATNMRNTVDKIMYDTLKRGSAVAEPDPLQVEIKSTVTHLRCVAPTWGVLADNKIRSLQAQCATLGHVAAVIKEASDAESTCYYCGAKM